MNIKPFLAGAIVLALMPAAQAQTSDQDKASALLKQSATAYDEGRYADLVDPANQLLAIPSVTAKGRSIAMYMRGVGKWGQKDVAGCIADLSGRTPAGEADIDNSARLWLGRCQVDAKQHDAAIATLGKLIADNDPKSGIVTDAAIQLGRAYEGKKQWRQARDAVSKSIANDPKWAWAWANRCFYEFKRAAYESAQSDCTQAIALKPGYTFAIKTLAQAYRYGGQYAKALPQYDAYAAAAGDGVDMAWVNNEKSLAYQGLKDWPNAIAMTKAALAVKPDYKWAWRNQSVYMRESGDLTSSLAAADKALAIDPDYGSALESKTFTQEQQEDWKSMLVTAQRWLNLRPGNKIATFQVARAQLGDKQYSACRDGFARLTVTYPDYKEAWNNLGACEHFLGNHAASRDAVGKALAMDPDNVVTNGNYGVALYKLGEYAKAIPYLQKAKDGGDPNKDVPRFLQYAKDKVAAGQTVKPKTTKELFADANKMMTDKKYAEAETAFASLLKDTRITTDADKMSIKEAQGVAIHFQKKYCESAVLIEEAQGLKRAQTYVNLIAPAFECAVQKKATGQTDEEIRWAMAALDAALNAHKAGSKNATSQQAINVANSSFALCKDGKWHATASQAKLVGDKWKGGTPLERATLVRCLFDPMREKVNSARLTGNDTALTTWRTTELDKFKPLTVSTDTKNQLKDWWKAGAHFTKLRFGKETALKNTDWKKLEKM